MHNHNCCKLNCLGIKDHSIHLKLNSVTSRETRTSTQECPKGDLSCAIHLKYFQLGGEELDAIENLSCKSTLSVLTRISLTL